MPNHSPRALIPGSFGDCWTPFFVTGSLMENQPDQTTLSMGNDADGLIMSEARDATAIDNLEDASFDFYGGVCRPSSYQAGFVWFAPPDGGSCAASLVLPFRITVTYSEGRQAAGAKRLFSILARRTARSFRVKVH